MISTLDSSGAEALPPEVLAYASDLVTHHACADLGGVIVGLHANTPSNLCHDWFSERAYVSPDARCDIDVYLIDMDVERVPGWLLRTAEASAAGRRLLSGSYVGLQWPEGACMLARHPLYCLWGRGLDGTCWRYLVKLFVSAHSIQHDLLHLKAACLSLEGRGVLIDGMSGAGKTTLLRQMVPMPGGNFVSNSHTLIDFRPHPTARGVLGKMRVRDPGGNQQYVPAGARALELEPGVHNLDPVWLFGNRMMTSVPVAAVVTLTPYKHSPPRIRRLCPEECHLYYSALMTAIHRYYIRDDLLEWLAWDPVRFHSAYERSERRLLALLNACHLFEVSADVYEPGNRQYLYELLRDACLGAGEQEGHDAVHH